MKDLDEASTKKEVDIHRLTTEPAPIHFYEDRDSNGRKLAVVYSCRVKWEELELTNSDLVRYCTNCSQPVFHVSDRNDYEHAVAARRCVMVKPAGKPTLYLGDRLGDYVRTSPLNWDEE